MKRRALGVLLLGSMPMVLTGCENVEATIFNPSDDKEVEKIDLKKEIILDHYNGGKYGITFKKVRTTDKRNSFASDDIQDVVLIDYEIQNYSVDENLVLYEGMDFKIFDSNNNQLTSYPLTQSLKYPDSVSIGETSTGTIAIGSKEKLSTINIVTYNQNKPFKYIKFDLNK